MVPSLRAAVVVLLLAFCPQPVSSAQEAHAPHAPAKEKMEGPAPEPLSFATDHTLDVGGKALAYHALGETTELLDKDGKAEAEFFTISYTVDPQPGTPRPITFVFNGGPGSSSVWLHMGLVGPRIVRVPSDGEAAGAPPYPVVDNPDTLLRVSDLVLVDPIGTGFSRVVNEGKGEDHWGVDEDAASVARFIRRYITIHERWASPKYLLGESYGGIRGPLLVRDLQSGFDSVALNGVILISPAMNMQIVDGQENDAALATVIPTYAATAWYHDALAQKPADLEAFLDEVTGWVKDEYVPALFAGREISDERRADLVDHLSRYTGISKEYIQRANLKISTDRFRRELLRDRGLVLGRLDTRYTGTEPDAVGEVPSGDPMGSGISGAYVSAFHSYLRGELGVQVDREYVVMSGEAGAHWKRPHEMDGAFQGYVDVAPALARGMADNPDLRVYIANGLYDIATTFFGSEHVVQRSTMDLSRVELHRFPAGHMMYVNHPTMVELSKEIRAFVAPQARPVEASAGN